MNESSTPANAPEKTEPSTPTLIKRLVNPLVVMLVLFGLPYVASWYFLNSDSSFSFGELGNNGELVSPVVPLGPFSLDTVTGAKLDDKQLAGNWLLITSSSVCEKQCQDTLLLVRQARKSTGVNRKVIKPILLLQNADTLAPFDVDLSEAFPQLSVIKHDSTGAKALLSKFAETQSDLENVIFMVDPYNNLMMYYPAGIEPNALMDDLKRLLKINKPKL